MNELIVFLVAIIVGIITGNIILFIWLDEIFDFLDRTIGKLVNKLL